MFSQEWLFILPKFCLSYLSVQPFKDNCRRKFFPENRLIFCWLNILVIQFMMPIPRDIDLYLTDLNVRFEFDRDQFAGKRAFLIEGGTKLTFKDQVIRYTKDVETCETKKLFVQVMSVSVIFYKTYSSSLSTQSDVYRNKFS